MPKSQKFLLFLQLIRSYVRGFFLFHFVSTVQKVKTLVQKTLVIKNEEAKFFERKMIAIAGQKKKKLCIISSLNIPYHVHV